MTKFLPPAKKPPKRRPGKNVNKNKLDGKMRAALETTLARHKLPLAENDEETGKRIYRRAEERPDPTRPGNAEVNRLRQQFKLRLDPDLIDQVSAQAKAKGVTRQEWVEAVIKAALDLD